MYVQRDETLSLQIERFWMQPSLYVVLLAGEGLNGLLKLARARETVVLPFAFLIVALRVVRVQTCLNLLCIIIILHSILVELIVVHIKCWSSNFSTTCQDRTESTYVAQSKIVCLSNGARACYRTCAVQ